jgi:hypothetical protein
MLLPQPFARARWRRMLALRLPFLLFARIVLLDLADFFISAFLDCELYHSTALRSWWSLLA